MMSVKLSMPVSERFQALAIDAAVKYAELCGCAGPAVAALADAVRAELIVQAAAAVPDANVSLDCLSRPGQVDVVINATGRPVTVHCTIPS
jgi:hypothetical protein